MKIRLPKTTIQKLRAASEAFRLSQAEIIRKSWRKGSRLRVVVDMKSISTTRKDSETVEVADIEGDAKNIAGYVEWYLSLPHHDPAKAVRPRIEEEIGVFQYVSPERFYG